MQVQHGGEESRGGCHEKQDQVIPCAVMNMGKSDQLEDGEEIFLKRKISFLWKLANQHGCL